MKKLIDNEKIEGVDEIVDITYEPKPKPKVIPPPNPQPETPNSKPYYNPSSPPKRDFYLKLVLGILFLVVLTTGMVWANISFQKKEFSTNIPVNNNIESPDVSTNISNQYDNNIANNITMNIQLDDEIAKKIANDVIKILNKSLNLTI